MEFLFYVFMMLVASGVIGSAAFEVGKKEGRKELLNHQHSWRAINATNIRPQSAYAETIIGWVCADIGCEGTKTQTLSGTWDLKQILAAKETKELEWPV